MGDLWTVFIIPAVLGLAFVIVQYFLAPRRAKLVIIPKNYAPLKMQLEAEFRDFEIKYQGKPIDGGFGWLSGFVFNEGPRDIHESVISEPLRLVLPDGFVWREVACIDHDCKPTIEWEGRIATLRWSMLRAKERLQFAGLLEAPSPKALAEFFDELPQSLRASQRIADARTALAPFEWRQYALDWSDIAFAIASVAMLAYLGTTLLGTERRSFAATYFPTVSSDRRISAEHPYIVRARNGKLCVAEVAPGQQLPCVAMLEPDDFHAMQPRVRPFVMTLPAYVRSDFMVLMITLFTAAVIAIITMFGYRISRARYASGGLVRLPDWLTSKSDKPNT